MNAKDILLEAADLLEKPGVWTRSSLARDRSGRRVEVHDPYACQFCALGAMKKVASINSYDDITSARHAIISLLHKNGMRVGVVDFNDTIAKSSDDIVSIMRKAAKTL